LLTLGQKMESLIITVKTMKTKKQVDIGCFGCLTSIIGFVLLVFVLSNLGKIWQVLENLLAKGL